MSISFDSPLWNVYGNNSNAHFLKHLIGTIEKSWKTKIIQPKQCLEDLINDPSGKDGSSPSSNLSLPSRADLFSEESSWPPVSFDYLLSCEA
jgi:hypothetical protein